MTTVVIQIEMPPKGQLEVSGGGSSPTEDQMNEETQIRQDFMDFVSPQLALLPDRPPRRAGNVSRVELLGTGVWSQMNHYLLLISVDIGDPGIDLDALVPPGGHATVIGSYDKLQQWPEKATDEGALPTSA